MVMHGAACELVLVLLSLSLSPRPRQGWVLLVCAFYLGVSLGIFCLRFLSILTLSHFFSSSASLPFLVSGPCCACFLRVLFLACAFCMCALLVQFACANFLGFFCSVCVWLCFFIVAVFACASCCVFVGICF